MNVHLDTTAKSAAAARALARSTWVAIKDREAAITESTVQSIRAQPDRFESITRERDPRRKTSLMLAVAARRINDDKVIKDLIGQYDRAVATATMYSLARIAELFGDGE